MKRYTPQKRKAHFGALFSFLREFTFGLLLGVIMFGPALAVLIWGIR